MPTTARGNPVSRNTFNDSWRLAVRAAGLVPTRDTGTHQLRHRFASLMLAGGVDIKKLSIYLGLGSAGFTLATYTHLMESADVQARKAIEAALAAEDVALTLDQEGEHQG